MKPPKRLKTTIAILFLLTFVFVAYSGAAEAKGSTVSAKPSVSTSKPITSKPTATNSSSSTSKPQTSTKPVPKPSKTISYTAKPNKNSSFATISNLSSGGKNKFDFSRPNKSMKSFNYSNMGSSVHYYGSSFMSNYIDFMIIQELMDNENDGDKNNDNDAWLLMYMILK